MIEHWPKLLFAFAAGGMFFYTTALISMGVFLASLIGTISLLVSIITLIAMVGMTFSALFACKRKSGQDKKFSSGWAIATFLAAGMTFIVTGFIIDWGPGSGFRSMVPALPEGNLLAGGLAGWPYLLLIAMLTLGGLGHKIPVDADKRMLRLLKKEFKEPKAPRKLAARSKDEPVKPRGESLRPSRSVYDSVTPIVVPDDKAVPDWFDPGMDFPPQASR